MPACRHRVSRRAPSWLIAALLSVAACVQAPGCAGPEARFRVLSIFFDGVPDPSAPKETDKPGAAADKSQEKQPELSVHGPYAERKCDLCHESRFSNKLKTDKSKLCGTCHSGEQFEGKVIHGPVGVANCAACHEPHRSQFPHLLRAEGSGVCLKCHTVETFEQLDRHRAEKGEDCVSCHAPHASDKPHLLK